MNRQSLFAAFAVVLYAALGFSVFPGRTWLQSDTQIYVPILERQYDPGLFGRDEVALRPHVKFTFYDEIAVGLRRALRLDFHAILAGQQFVFRVVGVAGACLIGLAFGLGLPGALFVAGLFGLGAVINGPAVLTLEYEPVPRGFAVLLIMGAAGAAMHRRWLWAGALAVLATLYHPTTAAPFWACLLLHWRLGHDRREGRAFEASVAAAAAGLALLAALQSFGADRQVMIGRIPAELEAIQKFRGAYNWISLWRPEWVWQYPLLALIGAGAWWRVKARLTPEARFFTAALVLYGLAMMGLQYLLLDVGKWVLMPQFQPARAVLFIAVMAELLAAGAGWHAAQARRWPEAGAWFLAAFIVPAGGPDALLNLGRSPERWAAAVLMGLAALVGAKWPKAAALAIVPGFFLIPAVGRLHLHPGLHTVELNELARWASQETGRDDVFLFADCGRGLQPGVFRALALRALYVDWKSGGQANLLRDYGYQWRRRWQAVGQARPPLRPLEDYARLGIDWIVVRAGDAPAGVKPAFRNRDWVAIRTRRGRRETPPPPGGRGLTPGRPAG